MRALAIRGLEDSPRCVPALAQRRQAWVTLLTNAPYARGAVALAHSLAEAESRFPLIVLVTDGVPEAERRQCIAAGCEVRKVAPLPLPPGVGGPPNYACAHFAECWSKLRVWELEDEFEQVVLLDADMVVLKNMDDLLLTPLDASLSPAEDGSSGGNSCGDCNGGGGSCSGGGGGSSGSDYGGGGGAAAAARATRAACRVRAVHECFCHVTRGAAPCVYLRPGERGTAPPVDAAAYFNSGLVVLRPSRAVFAHMQAALAASDLRRFAFPDQDFLNAYFGGAWEPLPYTYNATKGMYAAHRPPRDGLVFELAAVRNLHFTMAKPWDLRHPCHKGFERLNQLWHAAYAEPRTLGRVLLQAHRAEKRVHRAESS